MEDRNEARQIVEVGGGFKNSRLALFALSLGRNWVGDDFGGGRYQGPLRRIVIVSSGWSEIGVGTNDARLLVFYACQSVSMKQPARTVVDVVY